MGDFIPPVYEKRQFAAKPLVVRFEHGEEIIAQVRIEAADEFTQVIWSRISTSIQPGHGKSPDQAPGLFLDIPACCFVGYLFKVAARSYQEKASQPNLLVVGSVLGPRLNGFCKLL